MAGLCGSSPASGSRPGRSAGQSVKDVDGDLIEAGFDGVTTPGLDEFLDQADDPAGAAEQVFGQGAVVEHAVEGAQQPELLLDAD